MYIRRTTSSRKGKTYTNYLLVESVRTPVGPRQKVLCSLGDLKPRPAGEWLKLAHHVQSALVGQLELTPSDDPLVQAIVAEVRSAAVCSVAAACEAQSTRTLDVQPIEITASCTPTAEHGSPEESRHPAVVVPVNPRMASKGPSTPNLPLADVRVHEIRTERHREAGAAHVGLHFYRRLGIDGFLDAHGLSDRARQLICFMVLNRLIEPCSEHAMAAWAARSALEDLTGARFEGLDENALYRAMDRLHPHIAAVEQNLWDHTRHLFNLDSTIYLYDLTSTFFEGQVKGMTKAKRGYSRDSRPDCKQVVIGLVLNRDGFPIAHEVFVGNTQDRASLSTLLERLEKRAGLSPETMVVVDRGMAYESNLEDFKAKNVRFLVAARPAERDKWLEEFERQEGFEPVAREPSPRNPFQHKSEVKVQLLKTEDMTYVLCKSSERIAKDRAIREKQETRLLADLARLQQSVVKAKKLNADKIHERIGRLKERYPRVARYYKLIFDAEQGSFTWTKDEARLKKAEDLDGTYMLKTERTDLTAEEAWKTYTLLTRVENAFRAMKTPLNERPIFHQVDRRMETHIFLCLLAYWLLISIEKTLVDRGVHTSWATVRDTLKTHQVCTVVLPLSNGEELHIRKGSSPEPEHRRLYDLLDLPHEVMTPQTHSQT